MAWCRVVSPVAVRPDELDSLDVYFSFFNPEKKE